MDQSSLNLPENKQSSARPLVSVVLATYEPDSEMIVESLKSVGNQTYENVELVVIDGSDLDWMRTLAEEHDWIEYRYQEPSGLPAAWNAGIAAASGKYVCFLADDDYYAPDKLNHQVDTLEDGYDIVYSDEFLVSETGKVTYLSALPVENPESHYIDFFRTGHGVPHLTVIGRTECFETESFDEKLDVREDPHLWVRLFKHHSVAKIDEPLAYKRTRDNSVTSNPELMYENECREINMLCDTFPELREYREERERMAIYRYGKQLFHAGRTGEARRVFLGLLRKGMIDHRVLALLGASLLPVKNEGAFRLLQKTQEVLPV